MRVKEKADTILESCWLPSCHSNFQIKNFIIGKESSKIGKMWQCIREIQSRSESLDNLATDAEELNDNIELAKLDVEEEKSLVAESEIAKSRKIINIRKKERALKKLFKTKSLLETQKSNVENELSVFLETFESLGGISEFKQYNEEDAQLEYWNGKFETEFLIANLLGQPLSPEFVKSCLAVPIKSKIYENIKGALDIINQKLLNNR
jgi:hypothetical protein